MLKSDLEVVWDAFENERAASAWTLRSVMERLWLTEEALVEERAARQRSELRVEVLERALKGGPVDLTSGVRLTVSAAT